MKAAAGDKGYGSVDKIEALIFSGLIANDEKLPATFDGTDQSAALFKAVQGE